MSQYLFTLVSECVSQLRDASNERHGRHIALQCCTSTLILVMYVTACEAHSRLVPGQDRRQH